MSTIDSGSVDLFLCDLYSNVKRTLENVQGGDIKLSQEEQTEIQNIIDKFEVKGDRYGGQDPKVLHLWG